MGEIEKYEGIDYFDGIVLSVFDSEHNLEEEICGEFTDTCKNKGVVIVRDLTL